MGRKDGKPRGRMSSYAFFVQTCREEHKKKCPDENVVFAEFTKKCAQKWKVSTTLICQVPVLMFYKCLPLENYRGIYFNL